MSPTVRDLWLYSLNKITYDVEALKRDPWDQPKVEERVERTKQAPWQAWLRESAKLYQERSNS